LKIVACFDDSCWGFFFYYALLTAITVFLSATIFFALSSRMLPGAGHQFSYASARFPEYLRRIVAYSQMDLEYTVWQMFYLCVNPSRVYRTISWHRQTKHQWARDDPGFVAILSLFMSVASLAYAIAFRVGGIVNILKVIFLAVFVDFITVGVVVASLGWWISNKYLRSSRSSGSSARSSDDHTVEWLYAFDVHCNSFFPLFLLLYVGQFFLLPLVLSGGFFSTLLGNTVYLLAFVSYFHITFLGYQALPFLQHTTGWFLYYPIGVLLLSYIFSLVANFNAAVFVMNSYFGSVAKT